MEDRERLLKSCPEFDRLAFTVLAIEASAQKMGISPSPDFVIASPKNPHQRV